MASFLPRVSVSAEAGRNFGRSIDPNTNGYTNDTFDEGTVGLDMTLSLFEGFTRIMHIGELLDDTCGMSNSEILNYQLDKFREVMEQYKKKREQRIVFIHGKGDGVLRKA